LAVGPATASAMDFELVFAAGPDLDPGWRDALVPIVEGEAGYVFERFEPLSPAGEHFGDRGSARWASSICVGAS